MYIAKCLLPVQIILTGLITLTRACNIAVLGQCINLESNDLHQRSENETVFPVYDNSTLDLICGQMESANWPQCIITARSYCNGDPEDVLFNSTLDQVDHLCRSLSGYIEHRECFRKENVTRRGKQCDTEYSLQRNNVKRVLMLCGLIDTFIECVRQTIEDECNGEAAQWIYESKTAILKPTKIYVGCRDGDATGENDENDLVAVFILFSLGLLTLLIIVSSLFVCRFRRLRRQRSTTSRVTKQKTENGAFVAAEAVLTNSSDLHCCGHVTALVRDDHKPRPPRVEHMMMVLDPAIKT